MTTDATLADTAPDVSDTAPDTSSSQPDPAQTDATTQPDATTQQPDFALPEEYKDKPWAEKVKSHDDAYKQIDNLTALVGKKTIQPIDYATATPEEIEAHHASMAPESVSDYGFSENSDPDFSGAVGEILKKNGVNAHQGKNIVAAVEELSTKIAGDKQAVDRSDENYLALLKESFGDDYADTAKAVDAQIRDNASEADVEFFDKISDNETRAAVDRTIHSISKGYEDRIAKILKEHGVEESGAQVEGGEGTNSGIDIEKVRADIRKEIYELDARQHTAAEKQALQDKLAKTYE